MLLSLIVGVLVGLFFEKAQPFILEGMQRVNITLAEREATLVCFALCLGAAGLVLRLADARVAVALLCIGAAAGVARKPLQARFLGSKG